jgi:hypothetical protein
MAWAAPAPVAYVELVEDVGVPSTVRLMQALPRSGVVCPHHASSTSSRARSGRWNQRAIQRLNSLPGRAGSAPAHLAYGPYGGVEGRGAPGITSARKRARRWQGDAATRSMSTSAGCWVAPARLDPGRQAPHRLPHLGRRAAAGIDGLAHEDRQLVRATGRSTERVRAGFKNSSQSSIKARIDATRGR